MLNSGNIQKDQLIYDPKLDQPYYECRICNRTTTVTSVTTDGEKPEIKHTAECTADKDKPSSYLYHFGEKKVKYTRMSQDPLEKVLTKKTLEKFFPELL